MRQGNVAGVRFGRGLVFLCRAFSLKYWPQPWSGHPASTETGADENKTISPSISVG
jgi:hypothetical protein